MFLRVYVTRCFGSCHRNEEAVALEYAKCKNRQSDFVIVMRHAWRRVDRAGDGEEKLSI
jgi:hypothetical protein